MNISPINYNNFNQNKAKAKTSQASFGSVNVHWNKNYSEFNYSKVFDVLKKALPIGTEVEVKDVQHGVRFGEGWCDIANRYDYTLAKIKGVSERAEKTIERAFKKAGFPLVERTQFETLNEQQKAILSGLREFCGIKGLPDIYH